eukprot:3527884-Rhodomonas_salina.1
MAIDTTVVPLFRYTAGMAVVKCRTGDEITKTRRWWLAHLAAIEVPNASGVSRTLLQVSHEKGWQLTHVRVIVWEECKSLMHWQ